MNVHGKLNILSIALCSFLAHLAQTKQSQMPHVNSKVIFASDFVKKRPSCFMVQAQHHPAVPANQVMMRSLSGNLIYSMPTANISRHNQFKFTKKVHSPVNRRQVDRGRSGANPLVNFIDRRMPAAFANGIKNDLPLGGNAKTSLMDYADIARIRMRHIANNCN